MTALQKRPKSKIRAESARFLRMSASKGKAGPKESNYSESMGKYATDTTYAKEYRNSSTTL